MKTLLKNTCLLIVSIVLFASCATKEERKFSIVGTWGMVSGTISSADGTTERYEKHPNGYFYEIREFCKEGTMILSYPPDGEIIYGVYVFNSVTNELLYKNDGDKYYLPALIQVINSSEMMMTTNFGSEIGQTTQYFIKLD